MKWQVILATVLLGVLVAFALTVIPLAVLRELRDVNARIARIASLLPPHELTRASMTVHSDPSQPDGPLELTIQMEFPSKLPSSSVVLLYKASTDSVWQESVMKMDGPLLYSTTLPVNKSDVLVVRNAEAINGEIVSVYRQDLKIVVAALMGQ